MDFVVVGIGVGALGVLLGVLLRGWLAGRCERAARRAADPATAAYERANAAECHAAGQAFLAAGGAVVLATVGGLAGGLNDRSGALLVTTTATVAALGIIVWGFLYRSRHPLPRRPHRQASLAAAGVPPLAAALAAEAPAAPGPELMAADDVDVPDQEEAAPGPEEAEAPVPDETAAPLASHEEPSDAAAAEAADGTLSQDAHPDANGQPVDPSVAETGKIVAFVARGARESEDNEAPAGEEHGRDDR